MLLVPKAMAAILHLLPSPPSGLSHLAGTPVGLSDLPGGLTYAVQPGDLPMSLDGWLVEYTAPKTKRSLLGAMLS